MQNRLVRPQNGRVLAGVCAGLAVWVGLDVTLMRLIFLLLGVISGMGLLGYLILWLIIPAEGDESYSEGDWSNRVGRMRDEFVQSTSKPNMEALRIFGGVLVIIGGFALIKEIKPEWFFWANKGLFWAVALIAIGIILVMRSVRGGR